MLSIVATMGQLHDLNSRTCPCQALCTTSKPSAGTKPAEDGTRRFRWPVLDQAKKLVVLLNGQIALRLIASRADDVDVQRGKRPAAARRLRVVAREVLDRQGL